MSGTTLIQFISRLESAGELIRVREFVSPKLEIAEITDRIVKSTGKALLFENNGTGFPVLINAFGSEKRVCMALGMEHLDDGGLEVDADPEEIISTEAEISWQIKDPAAPERKYPHGSQKKYAGRGVARK